MSIKCNFDNDVMDRVMYVVRSKNVTADVATNLLIKDVELLQEAMNATKYKGNLQKACKESKT